MYWEDNKSTNSNTFLFSNWPRPRPVVSIYWYVCRLICRRIKVVSHIENGIKMQCFFLRFYLFIHERHTERGRDIGRGRSRLPVGSLMQGSIPGPWDHDLSQRQTLNQWTTQISQSQFRSWPQDCEFKPCVRLHA